MQGIWIHDARTSRFSDYAPSLLPEWDKLWWMSGTQCGPVDGVWLYEDEANDRFLGAAFVARLDGGIFDKLWRPGSMQVLAPHINLDEWSYFCGIEAPDLEEARPRARALNEHRLYHIAERVENTAEILILDADDGLLFVFSKHQDWLDTIAAPWKDVQPITHLDWQNWLAKVGT